MFPIVVSGTTPFVIPVLLIDEGLRSFPPIITDHPLLEKKHHQQLLVAFAGL
jgi:hypothetical protein